MASQLCLRNHIPFVPAIDLGVDLVLENGIRLQVKVSRLTDANVHNHQRNLVYTFNLRRALYDKERKRISKCVGRSYADVADFFVLWGIEENRFWIVPTSCKNRVLWFVSKSAVNRSTNAKYFEQFNARRAAEMEDRWDLLDVNAVEKLVDGVTESLASKEKI